MADYIIVSGKCENCGDIKAVKYAYAEVLCWDEDEDSGACQPLIHVMENGEIVNEVKAGEEEWCFCEECLLAEISMTLQDYLFVYVGLRYQEAERE